MTTEYKIYDKVLVECTVRRKEKLPTEDECYLLRPGSPHEGIECHDFWSLNIYSHVPEIKPGTRVNVRDNVGDDWKGVKKDGLELYYLAPSVFEDGHVIYAGYTTTTYRHVRPHVEESKTAKIVSIEVPDGYKVVVVKEEK